MSTAHAKERRIAELAVQKAVLITRAVLSLVEKGELAKKDKTSVSLADFASQAILVSALHHSFPQDAIVGEEDTKLLEQKPELVDKIWDLFQKARLADDECEELLYPPSSREDMLSMIDLGGRSYPGPHGRVWMIDPVDGTKGFLTGGQFVVCATLLVDGVEQLAVFGCPNVSLHSGKISEGDTDTSGPGILLSSVKGKGVDVRPLSDGELLPARKIERRGKIEDFASIRFCENVNTTSPQFPHRDKIAAKLALTLGAADIVLRTPLPNENPPHIWDHAGGVMVFEEAGGKVTDLNRKPLDLTTDRDLINNFGLVAAPADIHAKVLEATNAVFEAHKEYAGIIDAVGK